MSASDYSVAPSENARLSGINLGEDMSLGDVDNSFRQMMADTKGLYLSLGSPVEAPADGVTDASPALQAAITAGDCVIPLRPQPYAVGTQITLPQGRHVLIAPGTRFKWIGATSTSPAGALFLMADNTFIGCPGDSEFRLECDGETPFLSVVAGFAVQNVRVVGAFGLNCTQAYFDVGLGGVPYDDVVTTAMKAAGDTRVINTSRNITIIGGGCDFPDHSPSGALGQPERAGALMAYCEQWEIRDARYTGSYAAVQYWGGDSGLAPWQDMGRLGPDAERKNVGGRIANCYGRRLGAGFWGSMGRDIQVTDSRCYDIGDVGHDHEGSVNITMTGCHGEDCRNGAYATFSYSKRIAIVGCTGRSTVKIYPLFRCYNVSQTQNNDDITIQGGKWECTDPTGPGSIDTAFGPCRQISILGTDLINTVLALNTWNSCRIIVKSNALTFPITSPVAFDAIAAGGTNDMGFGHPEVHVADNTVNAAVPQPAGSRAIYVVSADFNSSPHYNIACNSVWMPLSDGSYAPLGAAHSGQNGGLAAIFVFFGNRTDGPIQTSSAGAASAGSFFARQNYSSINADVGLTAV